MGDLSRVFRALTLLNSAHAPAQHLLRDYPGQATARSLAATASSFTESEHDDSDAEHHGYALGLQRGRRSPFPTALWNSRRFPMPPASHVDLTPDDEQDQPSPPPPTTPPEYRASPSEDDEDTEGLADDHDDDDHDELMPALALDEALEFLAAERVKFTAQLHVTRDGDTSPRKKRRRRRRAGSSKNNDENESTELGNTTSTGDALSTTENMPASRGRRDKISRKSSSTMLSSLAAEKPSAAVTRPLPAPPSPQVQRLRSLAHKLKTLYPSQADCLKDVLESMSEPSEPGGFIDVRGPELTPEQPPVHVFVD